MAWRKLFPRDLRRDVDSLIISEIRIRIDLVVWRRAARSVFNTNGAREDDLCPESVNAMVCFEVVTFGDVFP